MHPIGSMLLGAVGLAAATLANLGRRRLQQDVDALTAHVDELAQRVETIPRLQSQTDQNTQALRDISSSVTRMEEAFTLLGERVGTQIEILEALQTSYTEKEAKLQLTLQAVIDAINEVRRNRAPAGV